MRLKEKVGDAQPVACLSVTCGSGYSAAPLNAAGRTGGEELREAYSVGAEGCGQRRWVQGSIVEMSLPLWQLDSFQKVTLLAISPSV